MKTRSNDIIPNAPFSYTRTGELFISPSNRIVFDSIVDFEYSATFNDNLEINGDIIFNGNIDSYHDSQLTFHEGSDNQSAYMVISPLYDVKKLVFEYNDGQDIMSTIKLDVSEEANILTDKNTKTVFGKSILKDPDNGNIDLYRHQLTFRQEGGLYFAEIISSSNLKVDSLQKLATLTKATTNYKIVLFNESGIDATDILVYNGSIWEFDIAGEEATFTTITDTITTL